MLNIPDENVPVEKIFTIKNVELYIKREDLIHPDVAGNKYWKLFYPINDYLKSLPKKPLIITFGGAFSNHVAAVSAVGNKTGISTLGIIRGEELSEKIKENPTLYFAGKNGMTFKFISREMYRHKEKLSEFLQLEFPDALIIPEGGTCANAVKGIRYMLNGQTKDFDYLCTAVGTGGTVAGICEFSGENQKILGFNVVKDDSLNEKIFSLTARQNFQLIDASLGGYGKINDENVHFINDFKMKYNIQLEPVYTGKMMQKIFELIDSDFFPEGSRILCFHTGGLQGIAGANRLLEKQKRNLIL